MYIEDSRHELKAHVPSNTPEILAGFANAEGGELVIGVKDDGSVIGVAASEIDAIQLKLENYVRELSPIPSHSISVRAVEGKQIIVVKIEGIFGGFCTYKGVFYYRHGSRTDRLEGSQLKDFLSYKGIIYFDDQPCYDADIGDIDEAKLKAFIGMRSPNAEFSGVESTLKSLGLIAKTNEGAKPKNAALLMFGKDPWRFFKQNEIRLSSFAGSDASAPLLDAKSATATIPENIEEALKFIKSNTRSFFLIGGTQHKEVGEYPERAVREAVINAVAHRDYFSPDAVQIRLFTNRIELINPGSLPEGISISQLAEGAISIKRNPVIYQLLRDLGYMEGIATGIPMIYRELAAMGLPKPEFKALGNFISLTFYNKLGKGFDETVLNERQRRAIELARKQGRITAKEYAKLEEISVPTAVADLHALVTAGFLKKVGKTRGAFYTLV